MIRRVLGLRRNAGDTTPVLAGRTPTEHTDVVRMMAMTLLAAALAACASESAIETDATVMCEPAGRFRVDGIEYEVQTYDDVVAPNDVGDMFAENLIRPPEIEECVPFFQLRDGETSLAPGTDVYAINGVDPTKALTAEPAPGSARYVRFVAQP